jgi:hypothetical protein
MKSPAVPIVELWISNASFNPSVSLPIAAVAAPMPEVMENYL